MRSEVKLALAATALALLSAAASPPTAGATVYRIFNYYEGLPANYRESYWEGVGYDEQLVDYAANAEVTLYARDKTGDDGQLYKCVGWKGASGITPASGSRGHVTFKINGDVAVTWLYRKAHLVRIGVEPFDQKLSTWGSNASGQLGHATGAAWIDGGWKAMTGGRYRHSVGVKQDGSLWAWGDGREGQVPGGAWSNPSPLRVGTDADWETVAAGAWHGVAIKQDGSLWAWGDNEFGQLGDGTGTDSATPVRIGTGTSWKVVAAGFDHTLALTENGALWAWGYNDDGEVGDGTTNWAFAPVQIGADGEWKAIAAGDYHSLGVKTDGTLWAWGWNVTGQLGDGTTEPRLEPVQVGLDADWKAVAAGGYFSLGLKSDGSLWAWGSNEYGQLGDGSRTDSLTPVRVGIDSDWAEVGAGYGSALAIKRDGTLWTWGVFLGPDISTEEFGVQETPTRVGLDTDWKAVSGGALHALALKADGSLWVWGYNGEGQLGDGTFQSRQAPLNLTTPVLTAISSGEAHTLALKPDGSLWAWGSNDHGERGTWAGDWDVPTRVGPDADWQAVSAGYHHSLALRADGTLWGWGDNGSGQVGDGTNTTQWSPVQIGLDSDWVAVAAGGAHSVALKDDGTLWAWGRNDSGQLGLGDRANRSAPVRLDLDLDGDGSPDADWASVAAGGNHTLALKRDGTLYSWGGGWVRNPATGNEYALTPYSRDWELAESGARSRGGHLVTVNDQAEHDWLRARFTAPAWTGASDTASEGTWIWASGELGAGYRPWCGGEPNNGGGNEDCAYMNYQASGCWNDVACSGTLPGLMERPYGPVIRGARFKAIAAGGAHSLAIREDGTLWAWGDNGYRQLGYHTGEGTSPGWIAQQVGSDAGWRSVAAGYLHSLAVKADGSLWAWGSNGAGQLGELDGFDVCTDGVPCSQIPRRVGAGNDWVAASAGGYHTAALRGPARFELQPHAGPRYLAETDEPYSASAKAHPTDGSRPYYLTASALRWADDAGAHAVEGYSWEAELSPTGPTSLLWRFDPGQPPRLLTVGVEGTVPDAVLRELQPAAGEHWYAGGATVELSAPAEVRISAEEVWRCIGWSGTGDVPGSGSARTYELTDLSQDSAIRWRFEKVKPQATLAFALDGAGWDAAAPRLFRAANTAGSWTEVPLTSGDAFKEFPENTSVKLTTNLRVEGTNLVCTGVRVDTADYAMPVTVTEDNGRKEFVLTLTQDVEIAVTYHVATRVALGSPVPVPAGCGSDAAQVKRNITATFGHPADTVDDAFHWGEWESSQTLYPVRPIPYFSVTCGGATQHYYAEWPAAVDRGGVVVGTPTALAPSGAAYSFQQMHYSESYGYGQWDLPGGSFQPEQKGRSLIRFDGPDGRPAFLVVEAVDLETPAAPLSCTVGVALSPPADHADPEGKAGYVVYENAYYDGAGEDAAHDRVNREGPIIPVNASPPVEDTEHQLVVVWYQRGSNGPAEEIGWGVKPVRYECSWPADAHRIVIAGGNGHPLENDREKAGLVYRQPDRAKPGFNPNEEHALILGDKLFALRNDLNNLGGETTSEPYVLLKHRQPTGEWGFKVFQVLATGQDEGGAVHDFTFDLEAGQAIVPLTPMDLLPVAAASGIKKDADGAGVGEAWYHRDHKGGHWAKGSNGLDGAERSRIVMQWHYPLQESFDYPADFVDADGDPVTTGAPVPFLNGGASHADPPVDVTYEVRWPSDPPVLHVGETLFTSKAGLPDLANMAAARIVFDENVRKGGGTLAKLFDPLSERSVDLAEVPDEIRTDALAGKVFFPDLPYALRARLSYDPLTRRLSFRGLTVEAGTGELLLLPNVLTLRDKERLEGLASGQWSAAVDRLYDETILRDSRLVGSPKALTAGGARGEGHVVLVENDDESLGAAPVALHVIEVAGGPYRGEVKVVESDNPFDEKLTLRHSGDFGGEPEKFHFAWYYKPDQSGLPPRLPASPTDTQGWVLFAEGPGLVDVTIEGAGKLTLSDNWFTVHYNYFGTYPSALASGPSFDDHWGPWAGAPGGETAQLAEGWIKRLVADLNPLDARVRDFRSNATSLDVSMLTQFGERWEGAVAMSGAADNLNTIGLIEAYQTVLDRGRDFSIDASPPVDYGPANGALLNAATRLADFYTVLGNEAYADAVDPTIGFDTYGGEFGSMASSIFAFQNQVATLLDEELALLRGRDDTLSTTRGRPFYNRLLWNFTNGDGEVAYVQTYNIYDQDVNGVIDELDARVMFPQGHGDAWGHYLTAMKTWYGLLRHDHYTWEPRGESVLVGGSPVPVDYFDERKFAQVAAAKAKVGAEIVNLTYRQRYVDDPAGQWQGYKDSNPERAWGVDEWARRAGQGAYFDWAVANAMLPETDPNPDHVGIQRVDRTTVPELHGIATEFSTIQAQADQADAGHNPLGLARGVVPFDIDPYRLTPFPSQEAETHFEQVYDRARQALENAKTAFDYANQYTLRIRGNKDALNNFKRATEEQELDYRYRLIELFGYPYAGDVGPGKTYPSGYDGPDIFHYMYMDVPELTGIEGLPTGEVAYTATFDFGDVNFDPEIGIVTKTLDVSFPVAPDAPWSFDKPDGWGSRRAPGEVQMALFGAIQAQASYDAALEELAGTLASIRSQAGVLEARHGISTDKIKVRDTARGSIKTLDHWTKGLETAKLALEAAKTFTQSTTDATIEALPKLIGFANDPTFSLRGAAKGTSSVVTNGLNILINALAIASQWTGVEKEHTSLDMEYELLVDDSRFEVQSLVRELEPLEYQARSQIRQLFQLLEALRESAGRYHSALAAGERLLTEREIFRKRTAVLIQDQRYQDFAFRVFRNDGIQKYRASFDLAQRYAYLAATAYDYETNLLGGDTDSGQRFLTEIVRQRAPGELWDGAPLVGRAGLADPLARLRQNFDVYKTQLGFNNPQIETNRFSLRSELFRLKDSSSTSWKAELRARQVADLWQVEAFRRYCRPFAEAPSASQPSPPPQPGLVIPFSTEVVAGRNFFGWPLGEKDSAYDPSHFATKIRSVGVWFEGYDGAALTSTPRVYLIPVGADVLRSPSEDGMATRQWVVVDQKLPAPYPISAAELEQPDWVPVFDSLSEDLGGIRRFASLRSYADRAEYYSPGDIAAESTADTRLVGRSVWNTQWLLIVPGGLLLADPDAGLQEFIDHVTDIKLFFQTYAYPGN